MATSDTLQGKKINNTYKDLVQVPNSNSGIDTTLRTVMDGEGTETPLQLSTTAVNIDSGLQVGGVAVTATAAELNYTASTMTQAEAEAGTSTTVKMVTAERIAQAIASLSSGITASSTDTLTNKTINLSGNTLTGTTAQFNTALSDGSFATLAGSETLTNKTLTAPVISTISNTGTVTLFTSSDTVVGKATTDTLTNKTLGAVTLSGTVSGADQTVQRVNFLDYGVVTNAIGSIGGGSQDIDLTLGNCVTGTVDTSTTTFTFSNPTAGDELCGFVLGLTNGGSQTVNWPASVDWAGGSAPTLTASGVDWLVFWTVDGGTIWNGSLIGAAFS